jgi:hypothetical protein
MTIAVESWGRIYDHNPVHDFAWHRTHRAARGGQFIDV